jgi:hypothetical protein
VNRIVGSKIYARVRVVDVLAISIISATLFAAVSIGSSSFDIKALIVIWLGLFASLATGRVLLSSLVEAIPESARVSAEVTIGVAGVSALMLLLCIIFRCSANIAFSIVCGVALIAMWFIAGARADDHVDRRTSGIVAAICGLSFVWSIQAIWAVPAMRKDFVFPAWQDFFYHGAMVAQFAHFSDFGGTWIFAHGTSLPLYHYAGYLLAAAISAFSSIPALVLASGFAEPFSFIIMGLGAWTLGVLIADRMGGVAAVSAVMTLPSPAHYWFANAYYDFHWLLQITTTGFSVGFSFLVVTVGIIAVKRKSTVAFWLAAILSATSALFKMQLFPLLFLSGLALLAIFWRPRHRWMPWAFFAALLVAGAVLLPVAELMPRAPHFLTMDWNPRLAIEALVPPVGISMHLPAALRVLVDLASLLLTAFGALLPFYVLALRWCHRRKCTDRFDIIPLVFVGVYCLIVLTFPRNVGDEFQHRSAALVYAMLAVWCALLLLRMLGMMFPRYSHLVLAMLCLALLPFPFLFEKTAQSGSAEWMKVAAHNAVPGGLQEAADYIRQNSSASEITLKSSNDGGGSFFGALTSISERSAYWLSLDSHMAWKLWGTPIDTIEAREAVTRQLLHADTFEQFSNVAQAAGINWYVLSPPDRLSAEIESMAVKSADGFRVFHFSPSQSSSKP